MNVRSLDDWLDRSVVGGYSQLDYRVRGHSASTATASDLSGATALVTGASSGLGEATCGGLARAGATVHMLVRDAERGERARQRVAASVDAPGAGPSTSGDLHVQVCDLADQRSIGRFADRFVSDRASLHVLVNNAGVMAGERQHTADGIELTFATNVLGPFLLTRLLMPALGRDGGARMITVSSGGMYTRRLNAGDLQLDAGDYDGAHAYAHTKRAEVILSEMAAQRCTRSGVVFHSMHPGWVDTPGLRESLPRFQRLAKPLLRSPAQGADTVLWLATSAQGGQSSGGFWQDRRRRPAHRVARTHETAADRERLWSECERLSAPRGGHD